MSIYIMPLKLKLTRYLAEQLMKDKEIDKNHDSNEEKVNYIIAKKKIKPIEIYN